jgi:hypothetical protein
MQQEPAEADRLSGGNSQQTTVSGQAESEGLSPPIKVRTPLPTAKQARPELTGKAINIHTARFLVALASMALLAFVVVASFIGIYQGQSIESITRLLEITFAPLVALVAAAVAFYYRSTRP